MLLIWSCDINVCFGHLYRPQTDLEAVKEVIFKLRERMRKEHLGVRERCNLTEL